MKYTHPGQIIRDGLILVTILMILQALFASLFFPAPPVAAPAPLPPPGCGNQPGVEFTILTGDRPTPVAQVMEDDPFEEPSTSVMCYPVASSEENQFLDLPTPLRQVVMVCANQIDVILSYTSERDPAWKEERAHAFLSLRLASNECRQIQRALNQPAMTVTMIWAFPIRVGEDSGEGPIPREVPCETTHDEEGSLILYLFATQRCFTGTGVLRLDDLMSVWQVCFTGPGSASLTEWTQLTIRTLIVKQPGCIAVGPLLEGSSLFPTQLAIWMPPT